MGPPYVPSVSFRCHLPSIWYRLYRDALATASTTLDEPLLPPLTPNATPKRGLPQEPRSKPEAHDVGRNVKRSREDGL
jgi:hypothetical protein